MAVLASREQPAELLATVRALCAASRQPATIDVLINGNAALAGAAADALAIGASAGPRVWVRVWFLELGDKANTWNQYVHSIWPGGDCTFFVDGYAVVAAHALDRLAAGLAASTAALAATGVPSSGRTARQLQALALREGHLHGNLFALKRGVMVELRQRGIRLPLGLYGYDGLIGAFMAFALDPARHDWDAKNRIVVLGDATWTHEAKKWWRWSDLKAQFQRTRKQALRALVVSAVRDFLHVQRRRPEDMPATLAELVLAWARQRPEELAALLRRSPLSRSALKQLQVPRDWSLAATPPRQVFPLDAS